jgi:membrane protease YdiL (CAAX protease family)
MYKFLTKNGQALAFGLGIIIAALFLITATSNLGSFNSLPDEEKFTTSIFDLGLMGAIALIIIALILTILFAIFQTATNFRSSIFGILGLVAIVVIFFIAYSSASSEATGSIAEAADKAGGVSPNELKIIGGGITTALVLAGIAVVSIVITEIINLFK